MSKEEFLKTTGTIGEINKNIYDLETNFLWRWQLLKVTAEDMSEEQFVDEESRLTILREEIDASRNELKTLTDFFYKVGEWK